MTELTTPATAEALDDVRDLMRAFVAWHRARHREDHHLIDRYFDAAVFEEELASLPGNYGPPGGTLVLASLDGQPAGCVALRQIEGDTCEMKRMFVYPEMQGRGLGLALGEKVIADARALGYRRMLLDTSVRQKEAIGLYHRLGFREIAPYYDLPEELRNWLVFMELRW